MSMEIGNDPNQQRNLLKEKQKLQKQELRAEQKKQAEEMQSLKQQQIESDSIQKRGLDETPLKQSEEMNRPLLQIYTSRFDRMSDVLVNARAAFDLPSPTRLLHQLSPAVQQQIQDLIDASAFTPSNAPKILQFFEILSRLIPLGASLLYGLGSDDRTLNLSKLRSSILDMLQETGQLMMKHQHSTQLSKQGKELYNLLSGQLQALPTSRAQAHALSEQLGAILGNTTTLNSGLAKYSSIQQVIDQIHNALETSGSKIVVAKHRQLVQSLIDSGLLPAVALKQKTLPSSMLKTLVKELENSHAASSGNWQPIADKPMAQTVGFLAGLLNNISAFPKKTQPEVIKMLISTQPVITDQVVNRTLGPHTVHFARSLSHMTVSLAQQLGLAPIQPTETQSITEFFTRIFTGLIITASILGRLQVDRGDGKTIRLADEEAGKAQRQAAQELHIHDFPPFSFFALWAPFENLQRDNRKKEKEAKDALSALMQALFRLVYFLVAIYTGGKKLGGNGIDLLLEENQIHLLSCLEDLIFALKTLHEKFDLDVQSVIERCQQSKKALLDSQYQEFWHHIFLALQEESDLKEFLEEVDIVDHFYNTIRTLVSGSGFNTSNVRM